jgi:N-carbamoylputrescine amidase
MKPVRIALIQMACREEPKENLERAVSFVKQAAKEGAQIICLPELFMTRYFAKTIDTNYFELAEGLESGSTPILRRIARECNVVIVSGVFERANQGLYYNTAVVIDPEGAIAGLYRKNHIPLTPALQEKFYFKPGDLGFPVFHTPFGKIGVLICYDRYFPEGFRILSLKGAHVILVPSACAGDSKKVWDLLLRAHAISNLVFIGAVNRIGKEGNTEFYGKSMVISPWGEVLKTGPEDQEEVLIADLDPEQLKGARNRWPFYRDLRVDAYQPLYRSNMRTEDR